MKTATVSCEFVSPFSMSKFVSIEKEKKENFADYEKRVWRERMHYFPKTLEIFIPPMMIKNCLAAVAKYLSMQIPGKGKSTYTKHFEAGILLSEEIPLGIKRDDVDGEWLHVPSDGRRGGTTRVAKCFPYIPAGTQFNFNALIVDDTITREVFEYHLEQAGKFIGLGRFRPRNNGYYGRFKILSLSFE